MPQPVDGGGIDPIYAVVEPGVDCGDRLVVILRAPREFPLSSADRPSSNPDRRNLQVALSERSQIHC
jgi:hypothetical protein